MICAFVLIADIWVNPCRVNYLYQNGARCLIQFTGHHRYVNMECSDVVAILEGEE